MLVYNFQVSGFFLRLRRIDWQNIFIIFRYVKNTWKDNNFLRLELEKFFRIFVPVIWTSCRNFTPLGTKELLLKIHSNFGSKKLKFWLLLKKRIRFFNFCYWFRMFMSNSALIWIWSPFSRFWKILIILQRNWNFENRIFSETR